jgi:polyhydroxyalkanoate synthesis regulator phasin
MTPEQIVQALGDADIVLVGDPSVERLPGHVRALAAEVTDLTAEVERIKELRAGNAATARDRTAEAKGRRKHAEKLTAEVERLRRRVAELEGDAAFLRGWQGGGDPT